MNARNLEAAFLQDIASNPHDWLPRLVFADWLEEQGDERGELIRLSHELTCLDCEDREQKEPRYQELVKAGVVWPSPGLKNSLGMKFVLIPPGEFVMGSPESEPDRRANENSVEVSLTQGFWLGTFSVTQGQWEVVMETTPWNVQHFVLENPNHPAVFVNHDDAVNFCRKLTDLGHQAGWLSRKWAVDLPTEAEWEYACRAGTTTRYSFGDDETQLVEYAWCRSNAWNKGGQCAHPVGTRQPNAWNLSDMHGNVWEWCYDWYEDKLPGGKDPMVWKLDGSGSVVETLTTFSEVGNRVLRGGSFYVSSGLCRSAYRRRLVPGNSDGLLGFRVALKFNP